MNDNYDNLSTWQDYKELCQEFREQLLEYILKEKKRYYGVGVRRKGFEIQNKGIELKGSIKKQRQDYKSDYS